MQIRTAFKAKTEMRRQSPAVIFGPTFSLSDFPTVHTWLEERPQGSAIKYWSNFQLKTRVPGEKSLQPISNIGSSLPTAYGKQLVQLA